MNIKAMKKILILLCLCVSFVSAQISRTNQWLLGGNTVGSQSNAIIGTNDTKSLSIVTNSVSAILIATNQAVTFTNSITSPSLYGVASNSILNIFSGVNGSGTINLGSGTGTVIGKDFFKNLANVTIQNNGNATNGLLVSNNNSGVNAYSALSFSTDADNTSAFFNTSSGNTYFGAGHLVCYTQKTLDLWTDAVTPIRFVCNGGVRGAFSSSQFTTSVPIGTSLSFTAQGNTNHGTLSGSNIHTFFTGSTTGASVTLQGLVGSTGQAAWYFGGVTPSALNFAFTSTGAGTDVNGTTLVNLDVNGNNKFQVNANYNYSNNKLQVGSSATPSAQIQIVGGSVNPNTAPLKFTSGNLMSTPEAAAVEYSANVLYFTPDATRYQFGLGLTGSATLDFPSTGSNATSTMTMAVTGASDGDPVQLGFPNAVNTGSGGTWWAQCTGTNTVTVYFHNTGGGSFDPASGTFKVFVNKN